MASIEFGRWWPSARLFLQQGSMSTESRGMGRETTEKCEPVFQGGLFWQMFGRKHVT